MSTTTPTPRRPAPGTSQQHRDLALIPSASDRLFRFVTAAIRLALGWVFLWKFADGLLGLGYGTASADAWIHGGQPARGFLRFSAAGPMTGFYDWLASTAWTDCLFMVGMGAIGVALLLGVAMRLAAFGGATMMVMVWSVALPPEYNPVLDEHIVYALALIMLAVVGAGHTLGLGAVWERLPVVKGARWLW